MTDNTYNGWTNKATWIINIYLYDSPAFEEALQAVAKEYEEIGLANSYPGDEDWIEGFTKNYAEHLATEGLGTLDNPLAEELMMYAFDEVNWRELANHYAEIVATWREEWKNE